MLRGLAIRGDDEITGSVRKGNYLDILELSSEYDDFFKRHIQSMQDVEVALLTIFSQHVKSLSNWWVKQFWMKLFCAWENLNIIQYSLFV